jgi:hypothetical protein
MTPEHPGFAAAVRVAKRTLAERIAASATNGRTPTDASAVKPVFPPIVAGEPQPKQDPQELSKVEPDATLAASVVEPLPRRPPDDPGPPDGGAKPWKKPWDK